MSLALFSLHKHKYPRHAKNAPPLARPRARQFFLVGMPHTAPVLKGPSLPMHPNQRYTCKLVATALDNRAISSSMRPTAPTSAPGRNSSNASLSTALASPPLSAIDARPLGAACPSNPFVRVAERFGVKDGPSGGAPRPPLLAAAPARGDSIDCMASIQPRVSRSLSVATRTCDHDALSSKHRVWTQ